MKRHFTSRVECQAKEQEMSLPFYRFLHGRIILRGKQPDGDSVRFVASHPDAYQGLRYTRRVRPSREDGSVQLRLEGIDAPEVHYGPHAQPYGVESRAALLSMLGFTEVRYEHGEHNRVSHAEPESVAVTVLTHAADANGRIVSYLLPHQAAVADGHESRVDGHLLALSYNHRMLAQGHAYFLAYTSTPPEHQVLFRKAALAARDAGLGLWPLDRTEEWRLTAQEDLGPDGQLIFPKLFRRSCDFLAARRGGYAGNLADWLVTSRAGRGRDEDDMVVLDGRHETRLSELLHQRNSRVALLADPLELAFVEH
jgi:endonuclease YncB( thermonuclease family)